MATFQFKMPAQLEKRGTTWESGIYERSISVRSERTHITFADYDSDVLVVACAEYIGFMEMRHEETPLEWWFVGSLFVLAIPVLTVAYILWDAYCVTTR